MTIDWWTLGFQTVNVAVLIWLLGHFFWKPVAAMIAARRDATQKSTDDAKTASDTAAAALADVAKTRAGFAKERETILGDAHKAADAARAVVLAKAKSDADALQTAAKADIAKDTKAQEGAWAKRSADLAVDIAGRLAGRLDGDAAQACFRQWLIEEIGKLPAPARKAAAAKEMKLKLASAVPLDAATQPSFAKAIGEALGGDPQIAFTTDSTLITGFELSGEHLIVRSSWRADLATIRADLAK
ncbi:F0F1 ATP synthase subunit B family protein [Sphingomonas sp. PAMC 26605]|uniref:F0F1 ATP synthase subunit B family protein n=1 Tax=Sphingomonas sp. PAMC 26605 TaxID=1112214 RepID=UPI00026CD23B|nr:ATP synthase F0 subunit B [Sphingomonas sp. PAMC 26605]